MSYEPLERCVEEPVPVTGLELVDSDREMYRLNLLEDLIARGDKDGVH